MANRTALILTGFQNDFCDPSGGLGTAGRDLGSVREMLPAATRLLQAARGAGILILHVAEVTLAGALSESKAWAARRSGIRGTGPMALEGSWGCAFAAGFEPLANELVVNRFRPTCMSDARTETLLRSAGVRQVVIAGVETHLTVVSTAIEAACRDYSVVVPADCVAGTLSDLHRAALALLPVYAEVTTSAQLIEEWRAAASEPRESRS